MLIGRYNDILSFRLILYSLTFTIHPIKMNISKIIIGVYYRHIKNDFRHFTLRSRRFIFLTYKCIQTNRIQTLAYRLWTGWWCFLHIIISYFITFHRNFFLFIPSIITIATTIILQIKPYPGNSTAAVALILLFFIIYSSIVYGACTIYYYTYILRTLLFYYHK